MDEASVGRVVRWARRRAEMTQQQLAEALHMPQPTIARIERGTVVPRTGTLIAILRATGQQLTVEPKPVPVDRELMRRRLAHSVPRRTQEALGGIGQDGPADAIGLLRSLRRFGVPFVLVGDLAEAAQGAPITVGREIEVVHETTRAAKEHLAQALAEPGAMAAGERRLSVMAKTSAGDDYDVLARNATRMPIESGILIRVASIDDLIRIRRAKCTPEDAAAATLLAAVAEEASTLPT